MRGLKILLIAIPMLFSTQSLFAQEDQEIVVRELKDNPEAQKELFAAVVGDEELLDNLINHLVEDSIAMQVLLNDEDFRSRVMERAQKLMMEDRDPEMMNMMMSQVANMIMNDQQLQQLMMENQEMQKLMETMGRKGQKIKSE